jgi:FkbH-like protein
MRRRFARFDSGKEEQLKQMSSSALDHSLESFVARLDKIRTYAGAHEETEAARFFKAFREIPDDFLAATGLVKKRLAILTGYTIRPLFPLLRLQALRLGLWLDIFESEFGLFENLIIERDAELHEFKPDLCYFNIGTEHIHFANQVQEIQRWKHLLQTAHAWLKCDVLFNNFIPPEHRAYGHLEAKHPESPTRYIENVNAALAESATSGLHIFDIKALSSRFGSIHWRDEKLYDLSKIPVAYDHWADFTRQLAAVIGAVFGRSRKCLVLDLDNTLWGGVIGDDGIGGIQIGADSGAGEGYLRFQTYIKSLKDRGVILAVCSKNDLETAKQPFREHPEMILRLEDISYFVANWERKDVNIEHIAKTLNIGLESLVFVDDNPAEREIVRQNLPQIATLELPEDSIDYTRALSASPYFESLSVTNEDRARTDSYKSAIMTAELQNSFGNYQDYLESLQMTATLAPINAANLPRITQLINKTNQFNLQTCRCTESEVSAMMGDPTVISRFVRLSDKFADHGLISFMMAKCVGEEIEIGNWLMSCRVLKRNVETLLMQDLIKEALRRGAKKIKGRFLPTAKNAMVADFYGGFGFSLVDRQANGATLWELDLTQKSVYLPVLDRPTAIQLHQLQDSKA